MNNLQKALEYKLDELLENIKGEWKETISPNEELFFETLTYLHQYDEDRAKEYSQEYNKIIIGRT